MVIESMNNEKRKMLKLEKHKRFTKSMNDTCLSLSCYWNAQPSVSMVPIGNEKDNQYQRPDHVHT